MGETPETIKPKGKSAPPPGPSAPLDHYRYGDEPKVSAPPKGKHGNGNDDSDKADRKTPIEQSRKSDGDHPERKDSKQSEKSTEQLTQQIKDQKEKVDRRATELKDELAMISARRDRHLKEMCADTKQGVGFLSRIQLWSDTTDKFAELQGNQTKAVSGLDRLIKEKQAMLGKLELESRSLEFAENRLKQAELRKQGKRREADTLAVEMWGDYGHSLQQLAPEVWQQLKTTDETSENAFTRLRRAGDPALSSPPELIPGSKETTQYALQLLQSLDPYIGRRDAQNEAVRKQALKAIDSDPELAKLAVASRNLQEKLPALQEMLAAGMEGTKFEDYVKNARERGQDIKKTMDELAPHVDDIKKQIDQLKEAEQKISDEESKKALQERIKVYEDAVKLFDPNSDLNKGINRMLEVCDSNKFDEDTFKNWVKREGLVVAGAIAGAVVAGLAVAATISTGGIAGVLIVTAASAGGALAGGEATTEALYHVDKHLDLGVGTGDQSKLGAYVSGTKTYDQNGKERDRTLLGDVVAPYAKEYAFNFCTMLATMGLGAAASKGITSTLTKMGQLNASSFLAKNAETVTRITQRTSQAEALANAGSTPWKQKFAREFIDEVGDEFKEAGTEEALKASLGKADRRLGFLSSLLVCTGKGVKANLNRESGGINLSADDGAALNSTFENLRKAGHTIEPQDGNNYVVTTPEGEKIQLKVREFVVDENQPVDNARSAFDMGKLFQVREVLNKAANGTMTLGDPRRLLVQHHGTDAPLNPNLAQKADLIASCEPDSLPQNQRDKHIFPTSQGTVWLEQQAKRLSFLTTDGAINTDLMKDAIPLSSRGDGVSRSFWFADAVNSLGVRGVCAFSADNPYNPLDRQDTCVAAQTAYTMNTYLNPKQRLSFIMSALERGNRRKLANAGPGSRESDLFRTHAELLTFDNNNDPVITAEHVMTMFGDCTTGADRTRGMSPGDSADNSIRVSRQAMRWMKENVSVDPKHSSELSIPVMLESREHAVVLRVRPDGSYYVFDPQANREEKVSGLDVQLQLDENGAPKLSFKGLKEQYTLPSFARKRLIRYLSRSQSNN